jgi:hypothetical protein
MKLGLLAFSATFFLVSLAHAQQPGYKARAKIALFEFGQYLDDPGNRPGNMGPFRTREYRYAKRDGSGRSIVISRRKVSPSAIRAMRKSVAQHHQVKPRAMSLFKVLKNHPDRVKRLVFRAKSYNKEFRQRKAELRRGGYVRVRR